MGAVRRRGGGKAAAALATIAGSVQAQFNNRGAPGNLPANATRIPCFADAAASDNETFTANNDGSAVMVNRDGRYLVIADVALSYQKNQAAGTGPSFRACKQAVSGVNTVSFIGDLNVVARAPSVQVVNDNVTVIGYAELVAGESVFAGALRGADVTTRRILEGTQGIIVRLSD